MDLTSKGRGAAWPESVIGMVWKEKHVSEGANPEHFYWLRNYRDLAYIVKSDPSLTAQELNEFCKGHPMLAKYKRPRYYRFLESLPLTATGKKMHYKVAHMVEEDYRQGLFEEV